MSEKEKLLKLIDSIPAYKLGYVIAYVEGLTADEEADDEFCEKIYEDHLNDPDPEKDKTYSLEECKKEWGLKGYTKNIRET